MESSIKDLISSHAWELLAQDPNSHLVDVRTEHEWNSIGVPDLSSINKKVVFIPWIKDFKSPINLDFLQELQRNVPSKDNVLVFICRSGGRSAEAAKYACAAGYKSCINVQDGFEGKTGNDGWKMSNLAYKVI